MKSVNRYDKCNFCENTSGYGPCCRDRDGNEFLCCASDHFYLDADKVVKEAKRLGVSVTDVLAMLDMANKLKGKPLSYAAPYGID